MDLNLALHILSLCYSVIRNCYIWGIIQNFNIIILQRFSMMFVMWSSVENDDLVYIFLTYLYFALDDQRKNLAVTCFIDPCLVFKHIFGVFKGDTQTPNLFIVLLEYVLKNTLQDDFGFVVRNRIGSRHPAIHVVVFAYADDI